MPLADALELLLLASELERRGSIAAAAQALAAVCEHHGLDQDVQVLDRWIDARGN